MLVIHGAVFSHERFVHRLMYSNLPANFRMENIERDMCDWKLLARIDYGGMALRVDRVDDQGPKVECCFIRVQVEGSWLRGRQRGGIDFL